jgi:hypothetical protein
VGFVRFIPECTVWPLAQTLASVFMPPTKRVVVAGIKCASQATFTIVGAPVGADSPHGTKGTCLGAVVLDGDLTCSSHSSFLLLVGMMLCANLMSLLSLRLKFLSSLWFTIISLKYLYFITVVKYSQSFFWFTNVSLIYILYLLYCNV